MTKGKERAGLCALAAQLLRARAAQDPVRVLRDIPDADDLDGYVLATGSKWTLLAYLGDDFAFDGYVLFRNRQVERVQRHLRRDYPTRLLEGRGQWPPSALQTTPDLDRTSSMVRTLSSQFPVLSTYKEDEDPRGFTVGTPVDWTGDSVWLTEVTPTGAWDDSLTRSRFRNISRVDIGERYTANLLKVAGPPPRRG